MLGWLLLVGLTVATLVGYVALREEKPWAKPVLTLCAVGLYFTMLQLLWPVLLAILVGVSVGGYMKGVKKETTWGKPFVSLCLAGIIIIAVGKMLPTKKATIAQDIADTVYGRGKARELDRSERLGKAMREHLSPGSKVLVMGGAHLEGWVRPAWNEGLEDALGKTGWEPVGYYGPVAAGAQAISEGLADREQEIDAVISYVGLPRDWADMSFYKRSNPPKVGAYFRSPSTDLELVRSWIEDGYLVAALVETEGGGAKLYTKSL